MPESRPIADTFGGLSKDSGPVAVALSGGVDSAVAGLILKRAGHDVFGLHMLIPAKGMEACAERARNVASKLSIPFYTLDVKEIFEKKIIGSFVGEYLRGRTPNPCILCNQQIKFGVLLDKARDLGAEMMATGHYARIEYDSGSSRYLLLKGRDPEKEQSYFLSRLAQDQLPRLAFPLGSMYKQVVRGMSGQVFDDNLGRESQEICFIPDGNYREFVRKWLPMGTSLAGEIVDMQGSVMGRHQGVFNFTVGQRRGIGLPYAVPLYVLRIDYKKKQVIIGKEEDLDRSTCTVENINWIALEGISRETEVTTCIRYNHTGALSVIAPLDHDRVVLRFHEPQRAITPGQTAVFYQDEIVVGSGFIS